MLIAPAPLETLTRLLNDPYIRGYEKRAALAFVAQHPERVAACIGRAECLIAERQNDPGSLENWATGKKLDRTRRPTARPLPEHDEPQRAGLARLNQSHAA